MQLLLERNSSWSDAGRYYVHQLIESCVSCQSTALPQPSRKVYISSLSRSFNDVVCIDRFYLEGVQRLHCIDMATKFSAANVVKSASLYEAVFGFGACWLNQF